MEEKFQNDVFQKVQPYLEATEGDNRPVVLMTCGLAGSGKTTLAKAVMKHLPYFTRLSIDEIIFEEHGIYGVDYAADKQLYEQYLEEADQIYWKKFISLLEAKRDVIVEKSFYAKEDRDEYKRMIDRLDSRRVFVYFKPLDKEVLWSRISARSAKQKGANNALLISRELFEAYWNGFEVPEGEGELVIEV